MKSRELSKRKILILIATLVLLLLALCVIIVSKNKDLGVVSFSKDTVSIEKYESYQLELKGAKDKKVTWESDNEKIAKVVDGVVYGRKKGNTEIHATVGRKSVSCKIAVSDNQYVPTIDLRETNDSVRLANNQTYHISPMLSYNGNTYTDVKYTYKALEGDIKVNKSGKITTSEAGEGIIAVTGEWRENTLETLLFVTVVDVSTSLEVGDNAFNIYLNGDTEEYPSKIDIGLKAFDKDVLVTNPHGSVTYVELVKEGDTKGAATIKKGIAHAAKLGTTHYVAQYRTASGVVVESAEFAITVDRSPADIYMASITGEEFEFFFKPLDAKNSVKWDKKQKAYHLENTLATASTGRGFIIDKTYLMNIIKYTKADSISFEVKTDGMETGLKTTDKSIYQGFYPDWFQKGYYTKTVTVKNWTKYTIYFKDIPKDDKGEMKTIFILNTVAGMYVRNIKPNLPGADTSNYDPNHNYLEAINGEDYEFFIEPLDSGNSVVWDKNMKAYHLENTVTVASNRRGFIFNKDYLTNIIKHTNAESITFEVKTDGKPSGLTGANKAIYQGFYPDWSRSPYKQNAARQDWREYTIYFKDIPLDADGAWKTIFLLNTDEGMYVRNIRPNLPGQSPTYDYSAPIVGESYKFFIEALNSKNSVKWDEEQQAYHLVNTMTTADTSRGFIFNEEYMKGIRDNTDAIGIRFQVKSDGKLTGISSNDKRLYQGYWPDWYISGQYKGYTAKDEWITIELKFKDFPTDKKGNIKTVYLMNTDAGMYLKNIEPIMPGQSPLYDYSSPIAGENYKFFIEALNSKNSVKWDEAKQAYHLANTMNTADTSRGFIFNEDYMKGIQEYTEAIGIRFQVKSDGKVTGITGNDKRLYQGYWPDWYVSGQYKGYTEKDDWITIELKFEDFPKDARGNLKTVYLMNTDSGMYLKDIEPIMPGEDSGSDAPAYNYQQPITGETYEFFIEELNSKNSVKWDEEQQAYHLVNTMTTADTSRGFIFNDEYMKGIRENTDAIGIRFQVKSDGEVTGISSNDKRLYQSYWPDWYVSSQYKGYTEKDEWITIVLKFEDFPKDEQGNIKTVYLMNTDAGMYLRNIEPIIPGEPITGEEYEFFIIKNNQYNSVEWDETKQAYHLINVVSQNNSSRGFRFDEEYMKNLQQNTDVIGIRFQVKSDEEIVSKYTGTDKNLYQSYYDVSDNTWGWGSRGSTYSATQKTDWITIELKFADFYTNAEGTRGTVALMNTNAGMYVRNIEPIKQGEELITGADVASLFGLWDTTNNSVTWDETKQAFHLINKNTTNGSGRAFTLNMTKWLENQNNTDAVGIRFQVKSDGDINTGYTYSDKNLYQSYYFDNTWGWGNRGLKYSADQKTDWITIELKFADFPKTGNGSLSTVVALMNTNAGMYVRDISFIMP